MAGTPLRESNQLFSTADPPKKTNLEIIGHKMLCQWSSCSSFLWGGWGLWVWVSHNIRKQQIERNSGWAGETLLSSVFYNKFQGDACVDEVLDLPLLVFRKRNPLSPSRILGLLSSLSPSPGQGSGWRAGRSSGSSCCHVPCCSFPLLHSLWSSDSELGALCAWGVWVQELLSTTQIVAGHGIDLLTWAPRPLSICRPSRKPSTVSDEIENDAFCWHIHGRWCLWEQSEILKPDYAIVTHIQLSVEKKGKGLSPNRSSKYVSWFWGNQKQKANKQTLAAWWNQVAVVETEHKSIDIHWEVVVGIDAYFDHDFKSWLATCPPSGEAAHSMGNRYTRTWLMCEFNPL